MSNTSKDKNISQKYSFIEEDSNVSIYDYFPKGKAWLLDKNGHCVATLLLDVKGSSRNTWSFTEDLFHFVLKLKIDGYRLHDCCLTIDKAIKETKTIIMSPSNGDLIKYSGLPKVELVKPFFRFNQIGKLVTPFKNKVVINTPERFKEDQREMEKMDLKSETVHFVKGIKDGNPLSEDDEIKDKMRFSKKY